MIAQHKTTEANTETMLHRVTGGTLYVASLYMCNTANDAATVSVAVVPPDFTSGDGNADYTGCRVLSECPMYPHETQNLSGMELPENTMIMVQASTAGVVFTLTGQMVQ